MLATLLSGLRVPLSEYKETCDENCSSLDCCTCYEGTYCIGGRIAPWLESPRRTVFFFLKIMSRPGDLTWSRALGLGGLFDMLFGLEIIDNCSDVLRSIASSA